MRRREMERAHAAAVQELLRYLREQQGRMLTVAEEAAVQQLPLSLVRARLRAIEAEMASGARAWALAAVPAAYALGRQYAASRLERVGMAGRVDPRYAQVHETARVQIAERAAEDLTHAAASLRQRVERELAALERERVTGAALEQVGLAAPALTLTAIRRRLRRAAGVTVVTRSGKVRRYGLTVYAALVADTSLTAAETEAQVNTVIEQVPPDEDLQGVRLARISSEIGPHTCEECARVAGCVVNLIGPGWGDVLGIDELPNGSPPPWHPNCVHDIEPLSADEARAFLAE